MFVQKLEIFLGLIVAVVVVQADKLPGAQKVVPVAATAAFLCRTGFKPFFPTNQLIACGNISFYEWDYPDHRPAHVKIELWNLPIGEYLIYIHYTGDTSDQCKTKAGKVYHELQYFSIEYHTDPPTAEQILKCDAYTDCVDSTNVDVCDALLMGMPNPCDAIAAQPTPPGLTGYYYDYLVDHGITLRDPIAGILGRAISIWAKTAAGGYDTLVGCEVIGMADQVQYGGPRQHHPQPVRIYDPVPPQFRNTYGRR